MQRLLAIVGPTAVGKTSLSIKLAQKFNGEIISGDSMQVYKYLNVGTDKIAPNQMKGIKHHLINTKTVYDQYSAADFIHDATELIQNINARNKLPIIVGGTGFYLQALIDNLNLGGDNNTDYKFRDHLEQLTERNGKDCIWQKLYQIDPNSAHKIPVNNVRRTIRALEVYHNTGQLFSEQSNPSKNDFNSLLIALNADRSILYKKINQRVDEMIKNGLIDEAKWLYHIGGSSLPASKGIGYHELFDYFKQRRSLTDSVDLIKKDSRHYAKRQLTWFRNKMNVNWFNLVEHPKQMDNIEQNILNWMNK